MVDRIDPARTGVKAGRVVGLLTAALAVVSLVRVQDSFYESAVVLLGLVGLESGLSITAFFWWNVAIAAVARYTIGYVVGSLVGVLYDWLDRPSPPVLLGIVLAVGILDGLLAVFDTGRFAVGVAYVVAWLCYVPAFYWLFDDDADATRSGPRRLGDS